MASSDGGGDASDALRARWTVLTETLQAFSNATSDPGTLLSTIAARTSQALNGYCGIALVAEDGKSIVPVTVHDGDPMATDVLGRIVLANPIRIDVPNPVASALMAGTPFLVPRLSHDDLRGRFPDPAHAEAAIALDIRSVAIIPLRAHGRLIGTLTLGRRGPDAMLLGPDDLELAVALANHAASAILNGRVITDWQKMADRLKTLALAGRDFADAAEDPSTVLNLVAKRVAELLGDFCSIRLVLEGDDTLQTVGAYHEDPEIMAAATDGRTEPRNVRSGITWEVFRTLRPILIPVTTPEAIVAQAEPQNHWFVRRLGIRSIIAVPLIARGTAIGVMTTLRSTPEPYTTDDLTLLEDLGTHAALAISNSRSLAAARSEIESRQRAEVHLERVESQLRQSQKMDAIGRLAGGVAHDFNNLLSVVLSYAELILQSVPEAEPVAEDVREIKRAGERAAELTKQLLAFSRQTLIEPSILDLNESVTAMERMLRRIVGEHITLKLALETPLGRVRADVSHIDQVIMNLVVNARDAMPTGGQLLLETQNVELDPEYCAEHLGVTPGPYVALVVSDTGVGMDRATQDRIFEPFFTTKPKGQSGGLGLATVFGIVKQSGGAIWVYSEVGRGTVMKVYFPRTDAPMTGTGATARPTTPASGERILLVEDDPQVRQVVRTVLTRAGYQILEASDGRAAIELAKSERGPIAMVLSDVVMPGMNGRETMAQLREILPGVRALFMSGYSEHAMLEGAMEEDVALVQKPVTPEVLLRKVREALEAPEG